MSRNLKLNIEVDDSGRLLAAYCSIREGKVARTEELLDGKFFIDYDKDQVILEPGNVLGIEYLGSDISEMFDQIVKLVKV